MSDFDLTCHELIDLADAMEEKIRDQREALHDGEVPASEIEELTEALDRWQLTLEKVSRRVAELRPENDRAIAEILSVVMLVSAQRVELTPLEGRVWWPKECEKWKVVLAHDGRSMEAVVFTPNSSFLAPNGQPRVDKVIASLISDARLYKKESPEEFDRRRGMYRDQEVNAHFLAQARERANGFLWLLEGDFERYAKLFLKNQDAWARVLEKEFEQQDEELAEQRGVSR